jgi:antitoxin VapB
MVEGWKMSLNIKNDETYRLTQELSRLTGESLTMAVTVAVRERLARLKEPTGNSRLERLTAIAKDASSRIREPWRSIDHGDFLYDENGLPK